ncbi:bifunctional adenosylcobinamide kinase/adenosylcobinamide-phosphate guanylyltransferase [Clostridium massiliamazoniense]|uniref:bifunctional adenosylcobinamide kinase/adenosylcobinamide-phosphate guanylyltransferase n=1 Tax=Clostridium massiliamazoniense TaxID=1347366 RepID=UPI0006D764AE|nr:bifunctional adenosylcobinamide kinase/adenosylcobinamide-phosphate guanylyltransferase [Clostridium massiliamazoniense]
MILVTGGARSGKSSFAENYVKKISTLDEVLYIATAIAFDEGMKNRIKKHREGRPKEWETLERYKDFACFKDNNIYKNKKVILLDCMTLLISNLLLEYKGDFDKISEEEIDKLEEYIDQEVSNFLEVFSDKKIVIVTNEVGMGLVPAYKLGSIFRDIAGRMNQKIAKRADEVYFLVSGIPMKVK